MGRILVGRHHICMALERSASRSSLWDAPSEAATAKHEAEANLLVLKCFRYHRPRLYGHRRVLMLSVRSSRLHGKSDARPLEEEDPAFTKLAHQPHTWSRVLALFTAVLSSFTATSNAPRLKNTMAPHRAKAASADTDVTEYAYDIDTVRAYANKESQLQWGRH
jgi:hypothetical protein